MKRARMIALVALAAAAGMLLWGRTQAGPDDAPKAAPATRVAVCDSMKVLGDSDHAKQLTEEFKKRRDGLEEEERRKSQEIRDRQAELGELKRDTKDYEELAAKIRQMMIELDVWRKVQDTDIQRDYYMLTRTMYDEVIKIVAELARERGIDVVLYRRESGPGGKDVQELLDSIERQTVIYNAAGVDLTGEVMSRVNTAYHATTRPASPQ